MTEHEKRIREALEAGPTEGPWFHNYDDVIASGDPEDVVAECAWAKTRPVATAQFIAACNPSAIRALLADLDAMRGALEKISGLGMSQFFKPYDMAEEAQNIARAALKGASHE